MDDGYEKLRKRIDDLDKEMNYYWERYAEDARRYWFACYVAAQSYQTILLTTLDEEARKTILNETIRGA